MCAIAGLINCGDPALLQRMLEVMAHRGPDSEGARWFAPHGSGLGHRRLAILDLSTAGNQPMSTPDQRYWITFNGEVYNFEDIRRELEAAGEQFKSTGDTEVILRAYAVWGRDCLKKFNGMFAFVIFDSQAGTLFAARDHLGIKPFYYHFSGGRFVFASEIKAILQCPFVERRPDFDAVANPARFLISPLTGFVGIHKLPPAHGLTLQRGELTIEPFWTLEPREDCAQSGSELEEELDVLLRDAVRLQMIADRPVGTFLSGGLDSSVVGALMRQNTSGEIHAFTIKFSEADQKFEQMPDDSRYARRVAQQFGFQYHEFELKPDVANLLPKMVWHLDEPLSDPASINTVLISEAARRLGIIVLLNGVGGDEIFGGYRKHLACVMAETCSGVLPRAACRGLESLAARLPVASARQGFRGSRWFKRFASLLSLPPAERYLSSDLSLTPAQFESLFPGRRYHDTWFWRTQKPVLDHPGLSYLTLMCWNDTRVFLPEHNLMYADKAAMAASIETRPPLVDYRIVEKMFTLPPRHRIRGHTQKHLLKRTAARYLPRDIVHRPKAPFNAPLRSWIRGSLAAMVDDLLSETSLKRRGLLNPARVRALIDRDRQGLEDNSMLVWTLLTNEIWFRTFFDGGAISGCQ